MKIYPSFLIGALWATLLIGAGLPTVWNIVICTLSLFIVGAISIRFDKHR